MVNQELLDIINTFPALHVVVLGEAMLDCYLHGQSERLCREAPVPVVDVREQVYEPGGAANTAVNVHSLGAQVSFISVTGRDRAGRIVCRELARHGLATRHLIRHPQRRTLCKSRVAAGSQLLLRFDEGDTGRVDGETEERMLRHLRHLLPDCDALILSDYGYGILTPRIIRAISAWQRKEARLLAVDAKALNLYRDCGVTVAKPNYQECAHLLGLSPLAEHGDRTAQVAAYREQILSQTGAQLVAVTLDQDGALLLERDHPNYRTYAQPRPNSQAAGAGDTFLSAMTLALAAGAPPHMAAEIASAAAAIVVARDGTSAPTAAELRGCLVAADKYVPDVTDLAGRLAQYRRRGRRLIFTNGCFDILHRGHITYLNQAKALGDVLIVGLNDDDSVRRLKGSRRPINALEDRAQVLSALSCIDHIVPFHEDTPERLIRAILPDIFVKGGDYTRETLPEAPLVEQLGGRVHILPYLDDMSTTGLIGRIRDVYARPANGRAAAS